MSSLLGMLNTLSVDNKLWLANKLIESAQSSDTSHQPQYPHISANWQVSPETLDMAIGKLPANFDWEKETEKMWEDIAK